MDLKVVVCYGHNLCFLVFSTEHASTFNPISTKFQKKKNNLELWSYKCTVSKYSFDHEKPILLIYLYDIYLDFCNHEESILQIVVKGTI